MSEEGIDPVYETTKNLVITNRLLWTGISVTNRRLEAHTKKIVENTSVLKSLTKVQSLLTAGITSNIMSLKLAFVMFTTQLKDSLYHIAKIMAESTFANIRSIQRLDRTLKSNTNAILNALGAEKIWLSKEELTSNELIESLNAFKGYEDEWIAFTHDPVWGKDFWAAVQEDSQETFDRIYNWVWDVGEVFIKQIGFIADRSVEFGKLKIKFFEDLPDILKLTRDAHLEIVKNIEGSVSRALKGVSGEREKKPGEGKSLFGRPLRYEGEKKGFIEIQKGIDKLYESAAKGLDKGKEFMKAFAKRQIIKAFQFGVGFLKQVISLGTAPGMEAFTKTLGSIAKIINVILIPLKPLIFVLDIFAKVLEAALSPMQTALYEALIPFMEDLVEALPDLMDMVQGWIDEGLLDKVIVGILDAFNGLLISLTKGNLMKTIFDLTLKILKLATTLISSNLITTLFKLTGVIIDLALTLVKPNAKGKTLIEQFIELTVTLAEFALVIFTSFRPLIEWFTSINIRDLGRIIYGVGLIWAFMHGMMQAGMPYGAILGGIYAGLWAGLASGLLSLQGGGEVPGYGPVPIIAHGGEQVWSVSAQEEMIELLEEQIYLQREILKMKEEKNR